MTIDNRIEHDSLGPVSVPVIGTMALKPPERREFPNLGHRD
ncbi:hypothetical protein [Mesorhizobium sp. STM 4661]|nr:hypothetical protein [Mesorhizobium sp. STM 4661]CCV11527.1 hypothetical protein MESS4_330076 [Mesorhizobium sp. STM 4661]